MFQYNTSVPSLQNLNFKMPPNFEGLDPTMSGWCWEGWIDVQGLKALVGSTNWSYTTPYDTVVTTRQTPSWHGTSSITFRASFVNPCPGTLEDLSFTNYPFFRNYSSGTIRLYYSGTTVQELTIPGSGILEELFSRNYFVLYEPGTNPALKYSPLCLRFLCVFFPRAVSKNEILPSAHLIGKGDVHIVSCHMSSHSSRENPQDIPRHVLVPERFL